MGYKKIPLRSKTRELSNLMQFLAKYYYFYISPLFGCISGQYISNKYIRQFCISTQVSEFKGYCNKSISERRNLCYRKTPIFLSIAASGPLLVHSTYFGYEHHIVWFKSKGWCECIHIRSWTHAPLDFWIAPCIACCQWYKIITLGEHLMPHSRSN